MTARKDILLLLVLPLLTHSLPADEDYDVLTRDPYEYQFKVDDAATSNRYEISESGNPDVVKGSYRIELPDGRTQIVTYEVHPEKGFDAKVTYEGTAQYPDNPDYVPSAYGPPEPIRPGYAKYKRQSQPRASKKKVGNKVREQRKVKNISFKEEQPVDVSTDLLTASSEKEYFKKQESITEQKNLSTNTKAPSESFDDTDHSPQAEPLSLRQSSPTKTTERPQEYKPPGVQKETYDRKKEDDTSVTKKQSSEPKTFATVPPSLVVHEAVPTSTETTAVYHINYVTGYDGQNFASPRDAFDELADSVFSPSVQYPEVSNLERTEPEKGVSIAQPITSYRTAYADPGIIKTAQPVAHVNEFLNIGHQHIPYDTVSYVDDRNSGSEENHRTSHRDQLFRINSDTGLQKFTQKLESPKIAILDVSNDSIKNHKKRKIDVKDYYKTEESNRKTQNTNVEPTPNENVLPTIYRSQIKYTGNKPTPNEKKETLEPTTPVKSSIKPLVPTETVNKNPAQIDNKQLKTEVPRDSFISIKTDKPIKKTQGIEPKPANDDIKKHIIKDDLKNIEINEKRVLYSSLDILQEEELYQTIFEENPPVTTRRPKFKIIRKPRVPKQLTPKTIVYHPVHRNQNFRIVQKDQGFVPVHVPRY